MDRLIPYSADVYSTIIVDHNLSLWPLQIFIVIICISLIGLARRGGANNAALMIVAAFWIWCGFDFHLSTYATLNWAAQYFGYVFIAQGGTIIMWALLTRNQFVEPHRQRWSWVGIILIISAAIMHPLILFFSGAPPGYAEIPGMMPTPTALVTIGLIYLIPRRPVFWLLLVPVFWAIWDGLSAWSLGLNAGLVLPCITVVAALFLIRCLRSPASR